MPTPISSPDGKPINTLVQVDDDEALRDAGPASEDNPVAVGAAFLSAVTEADGPHLNFLRGLVTPESRDAWGDFSEVAEGLSGCGITSRVESVPDDPDVVYVKYVTDPGVALVTLEETAILVRALGTLVRRPSCGGWRVHGVGERLEPHRVPRD